MDIARNMGQNHRNETDEGDDKFNKIREGERPPQKEIPKTG